MRPIGFELLSAFEEHDDAVLIRRYLTFAKFKHLLESKSFFFAPASFFADKKEGHYTDLDYEVWDQQLRRWGFTAREREIASQAKASVAKHNQQAVVISCWTAAPEEDPRMWREYGGGVEAVAVETTVGRLRTILGPDFLIVRVSYVDFSARSIRKDHSLQPYCHKGLNFQWEREIRVIGEMEHGKRIGTPRLVPIELASLIQRVIVSPFATLEFIDQVRSFTEDMALPVPFGLSSLRHDGA